jgi:hypothetical protein
MVQSFGVLAVGACLLVTVVGGVAAQEARGTTTIDNSVGAVRLSPEGCDVTSGGKTFALSDAECASSRVMAEQIRLLNEEVESLKADRQQSVQLLAEVVYAMTVTINMVRAVQNSVINANADIDASTEQTKQLAEYNRKFLEDLIAQYQTLNQRLDASVPNFR